MAGGSSLLNQAFALPSKRATNIWKQALSHPATVSRREAVARFLVTHRTSTRDAAHACPPGVDVRIRR